MNCKEAQDLIQRHFDEAPAKIDAGLAFHLQECDDCRMLFRSHKRVEKLMNMVSEHEPELSAPIQITDEMLGTQEMARNEKRIWPSRNTRALLTLPFRRMIAVAAMVLFAVFCYEQYLVLDRINRLESQLQEASQKNEINRTGSRDLAWELKAVGNFRNLKSNNKALLEKIRDVREKMTAPGQDVSTSSTNSRFRAMVK